MFLKPAVFLLPDEVFNFKKQQENSYYKSATEYSKISCFVFLIDADKLF